MDLAKIASIETAAANSLPSAITEIYDGWRLRYNYSVTRRANAVLAEFEGKIPIQEKLEYVEAWYKNLGVTARFQLCPSSEPKGLQDLLIARGYREHSGAKVQCADPKDIVSLKRNNAIDLKITPALTDDWLRVYETCEAASLEKAAVRKQMFDKLECPAAFVLAFKSDMPAAVGLGVLDAGLVGIFNMATLASMRKQGAARAVLLGVAEWARKQSSRNIYLQVDKKNTIAQIAYEKSGFRSMYSYNYFEQAV